MIKIEFEVWIGEKRCGTYSDRSAADRVADRMRMNPNEVVKILTFRIERTCINEEIFSTPESV